MTEWDVQIARFDICYASTSINRFLEAPRDGYLSWLVEIFGYLQSVTGRCKHIVVSPEDIEEISGNGVNVKDWLDQYPIALYGLDEGLPDPSRRPLSTSMYFDSDHAHNQVTRQSVFGVLFFVGSTPISCTRKRQGTIDISS